MKIQYDFSFERLGHMHETNIYIYIYVCVCVCVCVFMKTGYFKT
jgi:hypothetical protein